MLSSATLIQRVSDMLDAISYKGYTAIPTLDTKHDLIRGKVVDVRDSITFEAKSVGEFKQAFHHAVDSYLAFCTELGQEPEKPYSGKLVLRTTPENHRLIATAAVKEGMSTNSWMVTVLREAALQKSA